MCLALGAGLHAFADANAPPDIPKRIVSIDLETTGLQQDKHGICQIGAWVTGDTEDDFVDYFVSDANPHYPMRDKVRRNVVVDLKALECNGFTEHRIETAPDLGDVLYTFHQWLKKYQDTTTLICLGQNTTFDIAWLKRDFYRLGLDTDSFRRNLDCYTLSYLLWGKPMGLAKVCQKLGIKNRGAHDALADAFTASKAFYRMEALLAQRRAA